MHRAGPRHSRKAMSKPLETSDVQYLPESELSASSGGGAVGKKPGRRRVGKYRIVSELGRGGMANVYLALARSAGGVSKLVVLKALRQEIAEEPGALQMFLDEARLAAQLNHPNVVQTYEVGTEGDRHVIVMEHLEGQPLSRIIRLAQGVDRQMTEGLFLHVIVGLLEGLHYAHELKSYEGEPLHLVHRDVSPQNVFVTYDGQVKVLDFGIAKAATTSTQTSAGVIKGKIAYMAPEQMSGATLDGRADVFSVGCMLWAGATGRKLWKDLTDVQIVKKVLGGEIPNPKSINPQCSDELARIILKALAIDPEERYASARALQMDLEKYIEHAGIHVKRRELGEFVTSLFGDIRAELTVHIENQLSELANSDTITPSGYELIQQELRRVSAHPGPGEHTNTLGGSQVTMVSSGVPKVLVGVASGLAVLVGVLGWVLLNNDKAELASERARTPAQAQVAPVAQDQPASVKKATLRMNIKPDDAQVQLDGKALPVGIAAYPVEVREEPYHLRVTAPGHKTVERHFAVEGDMELSLSLESSTAPPATAAADKSETDKPSAVAPARPRTWTAPARKPATEAPAQAPKTESKPAGCDNPFYLDKNGIKKFRPECL